MRRDASCYTYGGLSGSACLCGHALVHRVRRECHDIRCSSAERKAIEHDRQVNRGCSLAGSMNAT